MGAGSGDARTVLRVERGQATSEEIAAVAVTLLTLLGAPADHTARRRGSARGVRRTPALRWDEPVYRAPHGWR